MDSTDAYQLRCDVIQDPFQPCSRCKRVHLECKIDSNFRRVGKRVKNAEMERELAELRARVAGQSASPTGHVPMHSPYLNEGNGHIVTASAGAPSIHTSPAATTGVTMASPMDQYMGSEEAVASLLGLRSGNGTIKPARQLENVVLSDERVKDLWAQYGLNYPHGRVPLTNGAVSLHIPIRTSHYSTPIGLQITTLKPRHYCFG